MASQSNVEKIDVVLPNSADAKKLAFILLNVLSQEECDRWIELSEKRGYQQALVNTGIGEVLMTDFRNSDRCIIDDVDMAKFLFERIKSYLPEQWKGHELVGLNERLRFLRYDPGNEFKTHMGKS